MLIIKILEREERKKKREAVQSGVKERMDSATITRGL